MSYKYLQKNLYFLLINLFGFSLIIFVFLITFKLIQSCITLFFTNSFNFQIEQLFSLVIIYEFYFYLIALVFVVVFYIKIFQSVLLNLNKFIKTQKFINSLEILKKEDYNIILNHKDLNAFTYGFFDPQIYISDATVKALNGRELEAVILHEKFHQKSRDPFKVFVINFFGSIIPSFLIKGFVKKYLTLTEIMADENVIKTQNSTNSIISSLFKVNSLKFNINNFADEINRITFLTKRDRFNIKNTIITLSLFIISINSLSFILNYKNIFDVCANNANCFVGESEINKNSDYQKKCPNIVQNKSVYEFMSKNR